MKKLLFIVNTDWAFLSHRLPIALAAIKAGYDVHIATPITDKAQILRSHGLIVHPIYLDRKSLNPISNLQSCWQLYRIIKKIKPDIVHAVTIKPVLFGGLIARLLRVPKLIIAISGLGFSHSSTGYGITVVRKTVYTLYRFIFSHPNINVIFQNTDDLAVLAKATGLPPAKTTLISGSGVDLNSYPVLPLPDSKIPIVMMACRLLTDKGLREFASAAKILRTENYSARFILLGDFDPGNPTNLPKCELDKWIADGTIEYWGYQSDMMNILPKAHIVVLPSYYREGLPKILIEAAACARAVITTNMPGCRDAIEPDITGLLVPARNSSALAKAIIQLLDNPVTYRKMGENGRMLAQRKFDIKIVIDKHLTIYN